MMIFRDTVKYLGLFLLMILFTACDVTPDRTPMSNASTVITVKTSVA